MVHYSLSLECLGDVVLLSAGKDSLELSFSFKIAKALESGSVGLLALLFDDIQLFSHIASVATTSSERVDEAFLNNTSYLFVDS